MELQILSKNVELASGIEERITKKIDHLDRISPRILKGELIFEEERGRIKGELILKVKGKNLTAKTVGKDLIVVTTALRDKMETQLRKYEGKLKSR